MLRSLKDLERYDVSASDGDLGRVVNFLLDDEHRTGAFFKSRRVLVSPISFRHVDWLTHRFRVGLTMDKIKGSRRRAPRFRATSYPCRTQKPRQLPPARLLHCITVHMAKLDGERDTQ